MRGDIINVGGHFVSKQVGLNFVGMHGKGGAPVPPPKPGSKCAGAGAGTGAGAGDGAGAGGQGGGDHGKEGGEGDSVWSPLKGRYHVCFFIVERFCFIVKHFQTLGETFLFNITNITETSPKSMNIFVKLYLMLPTKLSVLCSSRGYFLHRRWK